MSVAHDERLGRVALVGLGKSTLAAADYLLPLVGGRVESLAVFPGVEAAHGSTSERAREQARALEARGARVSYDTQELDGSFDLGVMSPGIPEVGPFFASARAHCAELVSEPELAFRESPADWVGITGTNGKTTTTSLACELLREAGVRARAVGNIGQPPIACVADRAPGEVFVAELSSFQLRTSNRLHPRVAVLLNVTPDHVEWHGSLAAYAAAKERLFANLGPDDLALVGPDEECGRVAARLHGRGVRVAVLGQAPGAGVVDAAWLDADGRLRVRLRGVDHVLARFADMRLKGAHNLENALAASACALACGADDASVTRGLVAFAPLAHRIEPCGEAAGVRFFDDSKGTNVDSTEKAVASFEPGSLVVMLGGHDKGTDLSELARLCARHARVALTYGEAGARFRAALAQAGACDAGASPDGGALRAAAGPVVAQAPHMREAFDLAVAAARPGESVLLSPACSSFDEFPGYERRGEVFQGWVRDLARGASAREGR